MKTVIFFNNKGGVGKTLLVYHLAWMFSEKKIPTLAVDFDPQANLTSIFFDEEKLMELWSDYGERKSVAGALEPRLKGTGDISQPHIEMITDTLALLPGDIGLSRFEDRLSDAWPRCHNGDESAFRDMTSFYRLMEKGSDWGARLVLIDVGPNLGAINRSALISSDHIIIPLSPDLFSLQGLMNLGPTIDNWRRSWKSILGKKPLGLSAPKGTMHPEGYIIMQHGVREKRPVKSYQRWMERIPSVYHEEMLFEDTRSSSLSVENDPHNLALLKHFRSLMPMSMEVRKPMFFLKAADGAIGSHQDSVIGCYKDFSALAEKIAKRLQIEI